MHAAKFITQNEMIFQEIFVVVNQKPCDIQCGAKKLV